VKSQDTIEPKIRNKNIQLSRMQDFAGVRFTLDCHHSELTHVGETIMEDVRLTGCQAEMRQYLESSQQGYRAVHVWISSPAGRVEIQLRTQLQNDWANTFEYLSDLAGRQIRYDSTYTPDDPLLERIAESMGQLSDRIYNLEAHSGAPLPHDLFDERLAIHDALNEHRIALNNYRKNLAGGGRKP